MQIAIVDLGVGNLRSVEQAMLTVAPNAKVTVSSDPAVVDAADKVVLPGQGAVGTWFAQLEQRNLRASINRARVDRPLLGICVGMQALFDYCAEDGGHKGLAWFDGQVEHFSKFHARDTKPALKIPQMGWNTVSQTQDHPLWFGIPANAHFYFVHSYCATSPVPDIVFGSADYGHEFIAAVGAKNVFATQFHPEKSHNDGLQLLKNFAQWNGGI